MPTFSANAAAKESALQRRVTLGQARKTSAQISVTLSGSAAHSSAVQPRKAHSPMLVTLSGSTTERREAQPEKVFFRSRTILLGMRTRSSAPQSSKAEAPSSVRDSGKETLHYFENKLNDEIEEDVRKFFDENQMEFRQENSLLANYYRTTGQKYSVRCQVRSEGESLVDLTLLVKTKEQAETICANWKEQNEEVYAYLMDLLMN